MQYSFSAKSQISKVTPEDLASKNYGISCYSEVTNPQIFHAPYLSSLLLRDIGDRRSMSLIIREIVNVDGVQFLKGHLVSGSGRLIYKGNKFPKEKNDILLGLSKEWNCSLYRGVRAWPRNN